MMMGYGFGGPFSWLGMGFGIIMHVAVIALVVLTAIWVFKMVFRGGNQVERPSDALDILKQRYAKGEITDEEYGRMKKVIE
jgi:putative membrane protein